jgi:regulatory protein
MRITSIKQQTKRTGRYSIFVDGAYGFSLSEAALLERKLAAGQALTPEQMRELKRLSAEDKLYNQTLRYVALRLRSRWEIASYLERKGASPTLAETIVNKLSNIGLVDDEKLARAFVNDRRQFRPASRRRIIAELRKKRIAAETIEAAMGNEPADEQSALQAVIATKRRQPKYRDDQKLMQYLARQGFNYGDIKEALQR